MPRSKKTPALKLTAEQTRHIGLALLNHKTASEYLFNASLDPATANEKYHRFQGYCYLALRRAGIAHNQALDITGPGVPEAFFE